MSLAWTPPCTVLPSMVTTALCSKMKSPWRSKEAKEKVAFAAARSPEICVSMMVKVVEGLRSPLRIAFLRIFTRSRVVLWPEKSVPVGLFKIILFQGI